MAAYDSVQWQVYANFSMQWSSNLSGTSDDTLHFNYAGGWGDAYYTTGGDYRTAQAWWDNNNVWGVTSGDGEWRTNNYNAEGMCAFSGLTDVYIAGALYGSTSGATHLDWAVNPTGNCANWLYPVIF